MAAIEHEIVKFVAEMELDAKTTAQFTQGLKDSNDKCAELRKTIVDTQKKLMEMKSAGKENSDAYKELEKDLGKYNTQLHNCKRHRDTTSVQLFFFRMETIEFNIPPFADGQLRRDIAVD